MSPRIARDDSAPVPAERRSGALRAEISAAERRARELDDKSIRLAQSFAEAQRRRDTLVADGAADTEISAARERVELLRRETEELNGARAILAKRNRELRAALVPVEAEETLATVVTLAAHLDAVVRPIGPRVRSLLPQRVKAASAAQAAERRLSASKDQRREELTGVVEAVPAIDELVKLAEADVAYITGTTAPRIERNAPAEAANADASPSPSPVSAV
jgi:hypothetical protein